MKKMIYRVLAYTLDIILINIVLLLFVFINPNRSKISDEYVVINEINIEYKRLNDNINKYYDNDGIFNEEEKEEINMLYPYYSDIFNNYENNKEITNEMKDEIKTSINNRQIKLVNEHGYNANKLNSLYLVIVIIVNILYFGVLEYVLKGETLFKKLFRIKTVNLDGSNISLIKAIIKSILICEIVFHISDVLCVNILNVDGYVKYVSVINEAKYIYELLFIMVMFLRVDARSVHDLILGTKLILLDKNGNEVESNLFNFSVEDRVKKEVKEESTKVTKSKSTKREFVVAEKEK